MTQLRTLGLLAALPLIIPIGGALNMAAGQSLFPSYAVAQEAGTTPKPNKAEFKQRRQEEFRKALDLTPEQASKIEQIRTQSKQANEGKREAMRAARDKMKSLMAGNASEAELLAQHRVLQGLQQEMSDARFQTMLAIRQELTPAQRTKMAELKGQRRGGWGRRRGGQKDSQPQ